MECQKCKKEITAESRFCPECGEMVKEDSVSRLDRTIDQTIRSASKCWFMIGFYHGFCLAKKDKQGLSELDDKIKNWSKDYYSVYQEIVAEANEFLEIKDE